MKRTLRVIIPLLLVLAIVVCTGWYLFIYDQEFTRDMLLHTARRFESHGKHSAATWFYNCAYMHAGNGDAVAIELAEQYKSVGNYTKAETTLRDAIRDGGGVEVYIALSKAFVEQDKLIDAIKLVDAVANPDIKAQLDALRPAAPTSTPDASNSNFFYSQYITVEVSCEKGTLYVCENKDYPSVQTDRYKGGITLKDGENRLHAVAISDDGLVSPIAHLKFVVGGVMEKVTFADAAVEQEMRKVLEASADEEIFTNDLWSIKEFTVPENTQDLSDLRHLVFVEKLTINNSVTGQLSSISALANLKELYITGTTVAAEELSLLAKLPSLQKLTLSNCSLSTVAGLEDAKELTYLDLSNNTIRDITPLSGYKKIQSIDLSHNALNDLQALSALSTLTELNVSHNALTTLSPIASIIGLKSLYASNNKLKDLTGFQQLTALQKVDLSYNSISNVSSLATCTELTDLNISNNTITDITALSALELLTDLDFSNNKVTKLPQWNKDCALVHIDGSYNSLDTLEPLGGLKKLNNVFMDYNKGVTSVKALATCPVLIQVNVYGTGVTQVSSLTSQSVVVNYDPTK